jgi:hypothetical protein
VILKELALVGVPCLVVKQTCVGCEDGLMFDFSHHINLLLVCGINHKKHMVVSKIVGGKLTEDMMNVLDVPLLAEDLPKGKKFQKRQVK